MSAAKIPCIRAQMRAQEILALELAGPAQGRKVSFRRSTDRRVVPSLLGRTSRAARQLIDAINQMDAPSVRL
jgi:hypothetical protein